MVLIYETRWMWYNYSKIQNQKQSLLADMVYWNDYCLKSTYRYENIVLKSGKQVKLNCKDKPLFGSGLQEFAKLTPLQLSAYPGF